MRLRADSMVLAPRHSRLGTALALVLCLLPLAYVAYTQFIHPRPAAAICVGDGEASLFYHAKLLVDGRPLAIIGHPDLPLYYLGYLVLRVIGAGLDQAWLFLRLHMFIAAGLASLALVWFYNRLLRRQPLAVALLALAAILCNPAVWDYWQQCASESFNLAVILPALTLIWPHLNDLRREHNPCWPLVAGSFLLGVGVAIKLSYLPLCAAVLGAVLVHALLRYRQGAGRPLLFLLPPLALLAGVLLFCLPYLPQMALLHFVPTRLSVQNFSRSLGLFLYSFPAVGLLSLAGVLLSLALTLVMALGRGRRGAQRTAAPWLEYLPGLTLVLLGLLASLYVAGTVNTKHFWDNFDVLDKTGYPTFLYRFTSQSILFAPLGLLLAAQLARARWAAAISRFQNPWLGSALACLALLAVAYTMGNFVHDRNQNLELLERRNLETMAAVDRIAGPQSTMVIWEGSAGWFFGQASFFMWSNYEFLGGLYDREVLAKFPRYRQLHLRNFKWLLGDPQRKQAPWDARLTATYAQKPTNTFLSNEDVTRPPFVLVLKKIDFEGELGYFGNIQQELPKFLNLLRARFGPEHPISRMRTETIAGIEWIFIWLE